MIKVIASLGNFCISRGIECLLSTDEEIHIYSVADPARLVNSAIEIQPDVVMVDFFILNNYLPYLPDKVKVILFDTGCGEENLFYALISKNVSGVIRKDAGEYQIKKAIQTVLAGDLWLDSKTVKELIARLSRLSELWQLTEIEADILHLVSKGTDDEMIAEMLGMSSGDINLYLDSMKKKMKIKDRWDLINLSLQSGKYGLLRGTDNKAS
jgi:two-component system, NarL family, response regulator LiaR